LKRDLPAMAKSEYDILVIGGGVIGCGIARDAALRGLRVALVEQLDFGWGTTARSTRLAHGGLRYLEQFDFGMVQEGLRERELLLKLAPHLVRPLQFLTPIYEGDPHGPLTVRLGLFLYDSLYWRRSMPPHKMLSRSEVLALEPGLSPHGLRGGALYYDGQIAFPERLCIDCLMDAAQHGAHIANYARVEALLKQGSRVVGARVRDTETNLTYNILAKVTINATGPWADRVIRLLNPNAKPSLRTTKGIHIVVPQFTQRAVVMLARSDGRLFFTVPWERTSLVGTTDTDYEGDPGMVAADSQDVEYLIRETSRVFPNADLKTIYYTSAGIRPLVLKKGVSASQVSRKHQIRNHSSEGILGFISVLGGKITAYRAVAEDAVDCALSQLGVRAKCTTDSVPIGEMPFENIEALIEIASSRFGGPRGLSKQQIQHLVCTYGPRYEAVAELALSDPTLREAPCEGAPEILAQAVYAAEHEMARTVSDVMLRRTGLGLRPGNGLDCVRKVAAAMGQVLGWDVDRIYSEVQQYKEDITLLRGGISPPPE